MRCLKCILGENIFGVCEIHTSIYPVNAALIISYVQYIGYLLFSDPNQTVLFRLLLDRDWTMVTVAILIILLVPGTLKVHTLLMLVGMVNSRTVIRACLELLAANHSMLSPMYSARSIYTQNIMVNCKLVATLCTIKKTGLDS